MTNDNQTQIDYWNGEAGNIWVRAQERMDAMLAPLSDQALYRAAVASGERVIDVGCGCGGTTLALAERGARVVGVDISRPMLARARQRAAGLGLGNVEFICSDAATEPFRPEHELIFSRFGVMFFADPVAAFTNLRGAMTDGGRLVFLCWQTPAVNPWVSVAGLAVQPFLPDIRPADPREPGPFAFADTDYLTGILEQAGFSAIEIESATADLLLGGSLEEAMQFMGGIGPLARVLSELEGESREAALHAVRDALAERLTPEGLCLGAAAWLVSARR